MIYTFQDSKYKYEDTPEESNLKWFKENNYREHFKQWLYNIRRIKFRTAISIDLSGSKQSLLFTMNLDTKGNGNLIVYVCDYTSFADIGNGFLKFHG